jgi:hypothetical protein
LRTWKNHPSSDSSGRDGRGVVFQISVPYTRSVSLDTGWKQLEARATGKKKSAEFGEHFPSAVRISCRSPCDSSRGLLAVRQAAAL